MYVQETFIHLYIYAYIKWKGRSCASCALSLRGCGLFHFSAHIRLLLSPLVTDLQIVSQLLGFICATKGSLLWEEFMKLIQTKTDRINSNSSHFVCQSLEAWGKNLTWIILHIELCKFLFYIQPFKIVMRQTYTYTLHFQLGKPRCIISQIFSKTDTSLQTQRVSALQW